VRGKGCALSAEVLRHRRALSSLHYLSRELEALSVVVEADGSSCCFEVVFFAGSNSVLDEVRLKMRRLGVLECLKVRPRKLFGSTREQLHGSV
jgi:glutamine phosphoribosylpyrophosphate amidotransferase